MRRIKSNNTEEEERLLFLIGEIKTEK